MYNNNKRPRGHLLIALNRTYLNCSNILRKSSVGAKNKCPVSANKLCPLLPDLDCKLEGFEHGIARWDKKYAYMVRTR